MKTIAAMTFWIVCAFAVNCAYAGPVSASTGDPSAPPPDPTCNCAPQCSQMWAEAADQIESITGMKLEIANDTLMETFNAPDASRLSGRVQKIDLGHGKFQIHASFYSDGAGKDGPKMERLALSMFNLTVGAESLVVSCTK